MTLNDLPECAGCSLLVYKERRFTCKRACEHFPKGNGCPYNSTKRKRIHLYKVWGGASEKPINHSFGSYYYVRAEDDVECRNLCKAKVPWIHIYGVRKCDANTALEVILHPEKFALI